MSEDTTDSEPMNTVEFWRQVILRDGVAPYSFQCGGQRRDGGHPLPDADGVGVDCERKLFPDSECVEWSLGFRNRGAAETALLSELRSLDLTLSPPVDGGKATIHAVRGCFNGDQPFALEQVVPERGKTWRTGNPGGAKTGRHLPFLNLDLGGRGLFCGLGWPGRWTLAVEHREDGSFRLTGGIERAELSLHPGEAISLPGVLLMFWEGDRMAAHNRFRQHILKFHSPTCDGQPAPDILACATWGGMKTHNHLRLIETLKQRQAKFDCYWIDAGWYGAAHETEEYQSLKTEDWFHHVGDWRPNALVHPNGLKPVSDAAHAAGMKFLLWFEVERAIESSPWVQEHPDWYFAKRNTSTLAGRSCAWRVFNFGNPEARQAMTEHMARLVAENGIDVYRQDCNVGLAGCWDAHDAPGRVGMAEIRYVEGLLAFWDGLKERFPHLLFDLVQRRDLASLSRSLDMSRSDHEFMPHTDSISSQAAQYGLSHWTPLSGTGVPYHPGQDYACLSGLSSSLGTGIFPAVSYEPIRVEPPADYPWDWLRRMLDIYRRARPFFRGDFYPLLEHVHSNQLWGAMQFHRADLGAGMVVVYRRPDSPFTTARLLLRGVADGSCCRLDDTGSDQLSLEGTVLEVRLNKAPAATVAFYRLDLQSNGLKQQETSL
jgi:alpha-galactosidase